MREIGEECERNDIPYVLELLVYPFLGSANHTADYVESPGKLPSLVIESVHEFAKPEYGVDLLKLESPLAANGLSPRDGSAAARAAQREFDAVGDICTEHGIPWVLLSGGPRTTSSNACSNTPMPRVPAAFWPAARYGWTQCGSIFLISRRSRQL